MRKYKQKGFTLIELLIAVAIIGVLARIAYPSYVESMTKSRRADAKSALLELSVFMERYYTAKSCYNIPDATSLTCVAGNAAPALPFNVAPKSAYNPNNSNVKANYNLTVIATPTSFTLTATPRKSDGTDYALSDANYPDKLCGSITLDNQGVKGENGTGTVADCW
jgi:type IV pilus assembly protein PilE